MKQKRNYRKFKIKTGKMNKVDKALAKLILKHTQIPNNRNKNRIIITEPIDIKRTKDY